jgi:hypothetical protein
LDRYAGTGKDVRIAFHQRSWKPIAKSAKPCGRPKSTTKK